MVFDFSDLADSVGIASGLRAISQPAQQQGSCSCECSREEHRRSDYLAVRDPEALFGTDEPTAPPVIGG